MDCRKADHFALCSPDSSTKKSICPAPLGEQMDSARSRERHNPISLVGSRISHFYSFVFIARLTDTAAQEFLSQKIFHQNPHRETDTEKRKQIPKLNLFRVNILPSQTSHNYDDLRAAFSHSQFSTGKERKRYLLLSFQLENSFYDSLAWWNAC